jgi:putative transferase (TIGR04331 family)
MAELYERKNADIWYAWGAGGENPMPSTKARKLRQYKREGHSNKILFVSTAKKRYLIRQEVELPTEDYLSMVDDQFRFYEMLEQSVANRFVLRPYPIDLGWGYARMWQEKFSGRVSLDDERDYFKSLESSRVVVTDHFSTTWLEAIVFDVPLIVYCDLERLVFNERHIGYFERMQSVSMLHRSAESAAEFLNKIHSDVNGWWMAEPTRSVVAELKDAFVSESDDFLSAWGAELMLIKG